MITRPCALSPRLRRDDRCRTRVHRYVEDVADRPVPRQFDPAVSRLLAAIDAAVEVLISAWAGARRVHVERSRDPDLSTCGQGRFGAFDDLRAHAAHAEDLHDLRR